MSTAGMMLRLMSLADNLTRVSSEVTLLASRKPQGCLFGFRPYLVWETKPVLKSVRNPSGASLRSMIAIRPMSYVTRNQVCILTHISLASFYGT